ncbi:Signal peptidase I [Candidatus Gromoviella agglomerans]|nr:Signal peptidase I [Candidatus Gromoviella agglomerans]
MIFSFKEFLYQQCIVPSSSMYPTLLINDVYMLNKWRFGYSNSSFWITRMIEKNMGVKLFNGRIFMFDSIKNGDVIVFYGRTGEFKDKLLVKRVIGVEGDVIKISNGFIYVNGNILRHSNFKIVRIKDKDGEMLAMSMKEVINLKEYTILKVDMSGSSNVDNVKEFVVPKGKLFCMGDNRDHSLDCRFSTIGCIDAVDVLGYASLRIFSFDNTQAKWWEFWNWRNAIRWDRLLTFVQ